MPIYRWARLEWTSVHWNSAVRSVLLLCHAIERVSEAISGGIEPRFANDIVAVGVHGNFVVRAKGSLERLQAGLDFAQLRGGHAYVNQYGCGNGQWIAGKEAQLLTYTVFIYGEILGQQTGNQVTCIVLHSDRNLDEIYVYPKGVEALRIRRARIRNLLRR